MDQRDEQVDKNRFHIDNLEPRIAPAIVLVNPAGNTPQGSGANNGVAIEGRIPPGTPLLVRTNDPVLHKSFQLTGRSRDRRSPEMFLVRPAVDWRARSETRVRRETQP